MGLYGILWVCMECYGFAWITKDLYGFLDFYMDNSLFHL